MLGTHTTNTWQQTLQRSREGPTVTVWPGGTNSLCIISTESYKQISIVFTFEFSRGQFFEFASFGCFHSALWRLVSGSYWKTTTHHQFRWNPLKLWFFFDSLIKSLLCCIRSDFFCVERTFIRLKWSVKNAMNWMFWTYSIPFSCFAMKISAHFLQIHAFFP